MPQSVFSDNRASSNIVFIVDGSITCQKRIKKKKRQSVSEIFSLLS